MIDHSRLAAIVRGSPREQGEVLADFMQANAADAHNLHSACELNDYPQITMLVHRMKGACLMLGANSLAESCSLLAMAGRAGNPVHVREALASYDRESAQLHRYLKALLAEGEPAEAHSAAQGPTLCAGLCFVVAEDHDFQRDLIMRLLRRLGAKVVHGVGGGAKALAMLRSPEHPIDILVLDLSMPDMVGVEVVRQLGECGTSVAVILLSALSPSLLGAIIRQTSALGVRILGALAKPLTEASLKPLLDAYRAGREAGTTIAA